MRWDGLLTSFAFIYILLGLSLQFVTTVFKTYLIDQNVDQFGLNLYKAGMSDRLLDFFPPNKRDEDSFARHFEAEDMKQLVTFQNKKQLILRKESVVENVKTLLEEGKIPEVNIFDLVDCLYICCAREVDHSYPLTFLAIFELAMDIVLDLLEGPDQGEWFGRARVHPIGLDRNDGLC